MADLYIVNEGDGEKGFLRECVAPYLGSLHINMFAPRVGKPGHKGGVRPWPAVRKEICNFLKLNRDDRPVYVSMMFDYVRMPTAWPGRADAPSKALAQRPLHVEQEISRDIEVHMGEHFIPDRFIPYVQMHELEALVLAEPDNLAAEFLGQNRAVQQLKDSIKGMAPEEINDGPDTSPGKRIIAWIPEYGKRKAQSAVNVLYLTGLGILRERCPHFDEWLSRIERLVGPAKQPVS